MRNNLLKISWVEISQAEKFVTHGIVTKISTLRKFPTIRYVSHYCAVGVNAASKSVAKE